MSNVNRVIARYSKTASGGLNKDQAEKLIEEQAEEVRDTGGHGIRLALQECLRPRPGDARHEAAFLWQEGSSEQGGSSIDRRHALSVGRLPWLG